MADLIKFIESEIAANGGLECYTKIVEAEANLNIYQADKIKMIVYISICRFKRVKSWVIAENLGMSQHVYTDFVSENKMQIIKLYNRKIIVSAKKNKKRAVKITDVKTGEILTFPSLASTGSFFNIRPQSIGFNIKKNFNIFKQFKAEYLHP